MNNWYVITGAPYSGKTTSVNLLGKKGYKITHETARIYIDQEVKKGKTIEEIRKNDFLFQKKILEMKINLEKLLSKDELIFLDRGIPDSQAYYQLCNKGDDNFLKKAINGSFYKKVFLLDFFDIQKDYARTETKKEQEIIYQLIESAYLKRGLPIIKVPIMSSKEERVDFILRNL